jgi:acetolactate synthase-1/2/3 large subunit
MVITVPEDIKFVERKSAFVINSTQKNMKVVQLIVDYLIRKNIEYVFAVPGVNIMPLLEEINKNKKINLVICKSEQGAAYMADGYAREHGIGCCIGTTGPGITNMYTSVCGCYYDSVPVVFISAQVNKSDFGKYGIQEMTGLGRTPNVMGAFKLVTKYAKRIVNKQVVHKCLEDAFAHMMEKRKGPVYLEFTEDVLRETISNDMEDISIKKRIEEESAVDFNQYMKLLDALQQCVLPVVVLGNGTRETERKSIIDFCKRIDAMCVCTALVKGKMRKEDYNFLGTIGCYGNIKANKAIEKADLIIYLGTSISYLSMCGWSFDMRNKYQVRVDIDKNVLFSKYKVDLNFCMDINIWIKQILLFLEEERIQFEARKNNVKSICLREEYYEEEEEQYFESDVLDPVCVMKVINNKINDFDYVVVDVGQNAYWAERYIEIGKKGKFFIHGGMGAMGYGIAAAIGIKLARKTKGKVVCICGDGGYFMTGNELNTAVNYNADVIWIVMNNNSLGTQDAWAKKRGYSLNFALTNCNIVLNARSLGVSAKKIRTEDELEQNLMLALSGKESILLDVQISQKTPKSYYGKNVKNINR